GGGPHQRLDRDALAMRGAYEQGAGVGDGRAAGFGHEADVLSGKRSFEQAVQNGVVQLLRKLANVQFAQRHGMAQGFQAGAGGFRILHDIMLQLAGNFTGGDGQPVLPGARFVAGAGKADGQEVKRAGFCCAHGRLTPSARSMRESSMSGRPTSAFGSSPRIWSSRAMPRPSDWALPAQLSASSRSR